MPDKTTSERVREAVTEIVRDRYTGTAAVQLVMKAVEPLERELAELRALPLADPAQYEKMRDALAKSQAECERLQEQTAENEAAYCAMVFKGKARAEAAGTNLRTESRSITEWLLDLAALFYRDVAVRQLGFEPDQLANTDVGELIDGEAPITGWGVHAILDTIEEAKRLVRANVDVDAVVLDALSRIATYRAQRAA